MSPERRYDSYEIDTEVGKRRFEFDPDGLLNREVRVRVDGVRVATVPFPKPAAPFQEVALVLDGHPLVGVTWLPPESDALGTPLGYDVFADGQSLSGREPLAEVRLARSTPRKRYPLSFTILDTVVRVTPWAAAPGLFIGLGRGNALGWARTITLLLLFLGALALAAAGSSRAWQLIRAREDVSELRRATLGWVAVLGTFVVAVLAVIALIVTYMVVLARP